MNSASNMALFYLSIGLAIASTLLYHITQKLTPANANPALALIVTYTVSLVLCVLLLPLFPLAKDIREALGQFCSGVCAGRFGSGVSPGLPFWLEHQHRRHFCQCSWHPSIGSHWALVIQRAALAGELVGRPGVHPRAGHDQLEKVSRSPHLINR